MFQKSICLLLLLSCAHFAEPHLLPFSRFFGFNFNGDNGRTIHQFGHFYPPPENGHARVSVTARSDKGEVTYVPINIRVDKIIPSVLDFAGKTASRAVEGVHDIKNLLFDSVEILKTEVPRVLITTRSGTKSVGQIFEEARENARHAHRSFVTGYRDGSTTAQLTPREALKKLVKRLRESLEERTRTSERLPIPVPKTKTTSPSIVKDIHLTQPNGDHLHALVQASIPTVNVGVSLNRRRPIIETVHEATPTSEPQGVFVSKHVKVVDIVPGKDVTSNEIPVVEHVHKVTQIAAAPEKESVVVIKPAEERVEDVSEVVTAPEKHEAVLVKPIEEDIEDVNAVATVPAKQSVVVIKPVEHRVIEDFDVTPSRSQGVVVTKSFNVGSLHIPVVASINVTSSRSFMEDPVTEIVPKSEKPEVVVEEPIKVLDTVHIPDETSNPTRVEERMDQVTEAPKESKPIKLGNNTMEDLIETLGPDCLSTMLCLSGADPESMGSFGPWAVETFELNEDQSIPENYPRFTRAYNTGAKYKTPRLCQRIYEKCEVNHKIHD